METSFNWEGELKSAALNAAVTATAAVAVDHFLLAPKREEKMVKLLGEMQNNIAKEFAGASDKIVNAINNFGTPTKKA